jgi:hypothetical protein
MQDSVERGPAAGEPKREVEREPATERRVQTLAE